MFYAKDTMKKKYLYLLIVFTVIFAQYPLGLTIGKFVFNQDLYNAINVSHLLLWGLVRLLIVLPLTFFFINLVDKDLKSIYLQIGDRGRMLKFAFWGTLTFTLMSVLLYPVFINQSSLTLQGFFVLFPFFSLFSISNGFVEETYFRGGALAILTERNPFWLANFIQAFFFGLIHIINPFSQNVYIFVLLTFFLGLLWGFITKKTKSLIPAILMHIVADLFVAISLF